MKKITSQLLLMTTVFVIALTSCKKDFFEDINKDNNRPTAVSPKVLLPAAEASIAFSVGGDGQRFCGIYTQYITGGYRQFYGYNRYIFTEEDFNNYWNNMYTGNMFDLNRIMTFAAAHPGQYDYYDACANILMAYSLGIMTDQFGDLPYSEAFLGIANIKPAFETQQTIYQTLQALLDNGISLINGEDTMGDDLTAPYEDDFIYNGDMSAWIAFANGLKARNYIHLTGVSGTAATDALAALAGALTGSSGNAKFKFGSTYPGPWFQYINERDDIIYDGYCLQSMITASDPRYAVYIDTVGDYWGVPGYLGPYFSADNSPFILFSYAEQKFIEAEAYQRLGDTTNASIALADAVHESMMQYGVAASDDSTYIANNVDYANSTDRLGLIMNEKYVADFPQVESWTDWRRTGYPALTVNPGVLTQIPRRFIYPTEERLNNPHCPQSSTLLDPALWWD
jgi:hypothetical protein